MINKAAKTKTAGQILLIDVNRIFPNKNQPRENFPAEEIQLLSDSIRKNGIIQPLTVRKSGEAYELVAGERRLRAAKMANLKNVPCIIMEINEQNSAVISLLENIQRSQLNFFEEAKAIRTLSLYYGMRQEEIAASLGMSQPAVSNLLRTLKLEPQALKILAENGFSQRHARALLRLSPEKQIQIAAKVNEKKLNAAQTEKLVEKILQEEARPRRTRKVFFKDVKIFINTINHAVETMQSAGIDAYVDRTESEEGYTITVNVPKAKKAI